MQKTHYREGYTLQNLTDFWDIFAFEPLNLFFLPNCNWNRFSIAWPTCPCVGLPIVHLHSKVVVSHQLTHHTSHHIPWCVFGRLTYCTLFPCFLHSQQKCCLYHFHHWNGLFQLSVLLKLTMDNNVVSIVLVTSPCCSWHWLSATSVDCCICKEASQEKLLAFLFSVTGLQVKKF